MKIDVHNHPYYYGYSTVKKFLANMDEYGIDKTWLLSCETPAGEWDPESAHCMSFYTDEAVTPFEYCVEFWKEAPERFILGYCPDPRSPYAIDKLRAAIDSYGVKVCGELKLRMMYDNPDAITMYRFCGENNLPVLVHIDYEFPTGRKYPRPSWWYGGGIEAFERAVEACPETNFIGHAPGFWAHISGDGLYDKVQYPKGKVLRGGKLSEMLKKYPNLYCDMSAGSGCGALSRDPEFTKAFLTEFSDRIMYGRDYFDNRHQEMLTSLSLSDDILNKIYYQNAARLTGMNFD